MLLHSPVMHHYSSVLNHHSLRLAVLSGCVDDTGDQASHGTTSEGIPDAGVGLGCQAECD
jgi:hypothetical protein